MLTYVPNMNHICPNRIKLSFGSITMGLKKFVPKDLKSIYFMDS